MKVLVDVEKCVAAGHCVTAAPGVFDQSEEDGLVVLLNAYPAEALRGSVQRAARLCPAHAIEIED